MPQNCRWSNGSYSLPSDVASYLFRYYEDFFDSSKFRTDTIFILNILMENNSEKMVGFGSCSLHIVR